MGLYKDHTVDYLIYVKKIYANMIKKLVHVSLIFLVRLMHFY